MMDDAGRPGEVSRRQHRGTGEQERGTASGWFSPVTEEAPPQQHSAPQQSVPAAAEQPPAPRQAPQQPPPQQPPPQQPPAQQSPAQQSPEQRYAEAISAMNRMVSTFDFEALPRVTEVFRATAAVLAENDPARPGVLNNLGTASQLTFVRSKEPGDLEDAVSYYRKAASTARDGDQDLVLYQCNLSLALAELATHTQDPTYALESAQVAGLATERTSRRDQRRMMALIRLGNALKLHARLAEDPNSDEESIDAFREAMRGIPGNPAENSELLINLGSALLRRYERGGPLEDLQEGINHLRGGVDGMPDGGPRHSALCHLATALRLSFHAGGDLGDLNAAINELLGVLRSLSGGHPLLGQVTWHLSAAAGEHVDCTGEPGQLRRVLNALGPAIRGIPGDDQHRADGFSGYGALLRRNFVHGAEVDSLDAAVSFGQAAADSATDPKRRCAVLTSLVTSLISRYEYSGDVGDLDLATTHAEQATAAVPDGTPPQHVAWSQLGLISSHRFRISSDPGRLETAVEMFDRALTDMSETAPARASVATDLGRALRAMHQRTGRRRFYRWSRRVLTEAANQLSAPAEHRLRAAMLCGRLAAQAQRWTDALESYNTAVELLPLVTRGKQVVASPKTQQRWALITADAAACALEAGVPEKAVELLEHGRAAMLSDFLPAGGEIGELHRTLPELADGLVRLRRLLDRPPEEPALMDLASWGHDDRSELAQAWTDMLKEVRETNAGHPEPPTFRNLASAGDEGPIALLNLSRYRSDALIVFGGRVLPVSLPGATLQDAAEQAGIGFSAVERQDSQALGSVLDWLWHNVTRPVLDRMGYTRTPGGGTRWPRMWWSPMGALAYLPLHAAAAESGHGVMDRVVSSYTPTLRNLLRAKQQPLPGDGRALVAAGSQEQIARELPQQNQVVAQYWPTAEIVSTESTASTDILRMLPHHPWVQVCERSVQYPGRPAADVVLDREAPQRPLTLVELGQSSLQGSEFAYLGKCTTVADTPSAAAIPLPSKLAFAGVTHVIGTLWGPDEATANRLHAEIYEQMFGGGEYATDLSAYAVHRTSSRLRAEKPGDPVRWAAQIHVGP